MGGWFVFVGFGLVWVVVCYFVCECAVWICLVYLLVLFGLGVFWVGFGVL